MRLDCGGEVQSGALRRKRPERPTNSNAASRVQLACQSADFRLGDWCSCLGRICPGVRWPKRLAVV